MEIRVLFTPPWERCCRESYVRLYKADIPKDWIAGRFSRDNIGNAAIQVRQRLVLIVFLA